MVRSWENEQRKSYHLNDDEYMQENALQGRFHVIRYAVLMSMWVSMPDDPSFIPGTYMVEGEDHLLEDFLFTHAFYDMYMPIFAQIAYKHTHT